LGSIVQCRVRVNHGYTELNYFSAHLEERAENKVCLHVFLTVGKTESRFLRAARASLEAKLFHRVVLAAKWEPGLAEHEILEPGVEIFRIRLTSLAWGRSLFPQIAKCVEWYWRIYKLALRLKPVLIVGHSLAGLPISCILAARLRVPAIYDAHELETKVTNLRGVRLWIAEMAERHYIRKVDAVLVVSDSIADWYADAYKIKRPRVVRNMPELLGKRPAADASLWRNRFGIPASHLIFIYQGGLFPGRRIEKILHVFAKAKLDRHVVFMGYGELESLVRSAANQHSNIHLAESVHPMEVLRNTAGADVGLVGVEPVCLSYYYSLPNKLFEYLTAGIPVIYPNFPEMKKLIESSGAGWCVEEPDEQWLVLIDNLTMKDIETARSHISVMIKTISWEDEKQLLIDCFRTFCHQKPIR